MTPDSFFRLLPAVYRIRDIERGRPLEALMKVIGEQVAYVHADIEHLYDNWFIETCDDWVVPYLGELVGFRRSSPVGEPGDAAVAGELELLRRLYPRPEVSRLIAARRRKGTLPVLKELARNVAGWRARALESFELLVIAAVASQTAPRDRHAVASVHPSSRSRKHTDVGALRRSIAVRSSATPSAFSPGSTSNQLTLLVWRRFARSMTGTEAAPIAIQGKTTRPNPSGSPWHFYSFSPFGFDTPLAIKEDTDDQQLTDVNALAMTRFLLPDLLKADVTARINTEGSVLYGESLKIDGVNARHIGVTDLSSWNFPFEPFRPDIQAYIDPVRGRIAFAGELRQPVSYHFATKNELGGGEYARAVARHNEYPVHRFAPATSRLPHRSQLDAFFARHTLAKSSSAQISSSVGFELASSSIHRCHISRIRIREGQVLELRAANNTFPIIRFSDRRDNLQPISIDMQKGSQLVIDGLAILARAIHIKFFESGRPSNVIDCCCGSSDSACECCDTTTKRDEQPPEVYVRHCTIVPRTQRHLGTGTIHLCLPGGKMIVRSSILAEVRINNACEVRSICPRTPVVLSLENSIVQRSIAQEQPNIVSAALSCRRSTILGRTHVHRIDSADDMIFLGETTVERRQVGAIRYSYVRPSPSLNRRFKCVPDETNPTLKPMFVAKKFGKFGFAELHIDCDPRISQGAESGSEMGAFHNLFEAQRKARLTSQLAEFTPANMRPMIQFADETAPVYP